jgi:small subunit ribosomal protein S16
MRRPLLVRPARLTERSRRLIPGRFGPARIYRWEKTTVVAVKIKLKRMGKIREPYYRIVVADARTKRDGRAIEEIGKYHPKADPSVIEVNSERVQHWLSVGAQPTDPVRVLLKITGDWQKFTGEPGAEGTLRTAKPREDKKERFTAAAKESQATKEAKEGAKESRAASKASKPAKSSAAKDRAPAAEAAAPAAEAAAADVTSEAVAGAKPVEAKATEAKAADAKPVEAKATEAKPADAKPAEAKAADAEPKPADAEAKPADADAEPKPADAEAKPADADAEPKPADAEAKPAEGDSGSGA